MGHIAGRTVDIARAVAPIDQVLGDRIHARVRYRTERQCVGCSLVDTAGSRQGDCRSDIARRHGEGVGVAASLNVVECDGDCVDAVVGIGVSTVKGAGGWCPGRARGVDRRIARYRRCAVSPIDLVREIGRLPGRSAERRSERADVRQGEGTAFAGYLVADNRQGRRQVAHRDQEGSRVRPAVVVLNGDSHGVSAVLGVHMGAVERSSGGCFRRPVRIDQRRALVESCTVAPVDRVGECLGRPETRIAECADIRQGKECPFVDRLVAHDLQCGSDVADCYCCGSVGDRLARVFASNGNKRMIDVVVCVNVFGGDRADSVPRRRMSIGSCSRTVVPSHLGRVRTVRGPCRIRVGGVLESDETSLVNDKAEPGTDGRHRQHTPLFQRDNDETNPFVIPSGTDRGDQSAAQVGQPTHESSL